LNFISVRSGLKVLPLVGAGSLLLAHPLKAVAFRRRADAMIARLEHASVAEVSTPPIPAIIRSFAQRAVCEIPVPNTVWLSQRGEMRANLGDPWRRFTAEQVISIHKPGFVWLARMQAASLASARILDCYVDGDPRFRHLLCAGLRLRLPARGMAVWRGRSNLVARGLAPLVAGAGLKPSLAVKDLVSGIS
jgi:hypothetical protein